MLTNGLQRAIATPTSPQAPDKPPQRRIPRRVKQAIELLLTGECSTQKAAAQRVGLTAEWLCRALQKDNARVFCERRVRQTIAAGLMPAGARLVELVHAGSEHVSLDATKHLLAIGGIAPAPTTSVNVNVELKAGYVIDLSENPWKEQIIEHEQTQSHPQPGSDEKV